MGLYNTIKMFTEVIVVAVRFLPTRGLLSHFYSILCSLPDHCNSPDPFTKIPVRELCFAHISVLLVLAFTLKRFISEVL